MEQEYIKGDIVMYDNKIHTIYVFTKATKYRSILWTT